jgi:ATP-dependent Clp protease ATP-binding subunit ClpB
MKSQFRPEFLNRVDDTIIFDRLTEKELTSIIDIQLTRVQQRLAKQNMRLVLTDALKRIVAREGFDPVYGARPLKRAIQRFVLDPLSLELLEGHFKEGDVIVADAIRDKVQFRKEIFAK